MMERPMRRMLFGADELFAVVAYALGYQPDDDLVVVLLTEQSQIRAVERYALHTPPATVLADLLPLLSFTTRMWRSSLGTVLRRRARR